MHKPFMMMFISAMLLGPSSSAAALGFEAGPLSGLALERAPVSARLTPYLGVRIGFGITVTRGSVDLETGFIAGALLGQVFSFSETGYYTFEDHAAWHPRVGLALGLEFGDYVFASTGSLSAPPTPQVFFGARLDPLRFSVGSWDISYLEIGVFTGSIGWFTSARIELGLMSLTYRW